MAGSIGSLAMRRDRIAAMLALAALSSCGGPARPAGRAEPAEVGRALDACSLITAGDAAALLGGPVSAPTVAEREVAASGVSQCSYRAGTGGYLTVLARTAATREGAAEAFERARSLAKALTGEDPLDVREVGERAYWTGGTFKQLNVLEGTVWLIVSADRGGGGDRFEETRRVARKALERSRR